MSQENVEIVRRIYDRMNRGDVEGVVQLCHEDVVIDMSGRVFNPDVYHGHDGIRRFHAGVQDAWESYQWGIEDTRTTGDAVVAMLHCHGRSREGGPDVDWRVAWVWTLQGGRAATVRFYRDRMRALEATGLRE
jgi:ketosteroid isomerase-like protein